MDELASHLCECGLDTEYWLPQLDKRLGVKTIAKLNLLEGDIHTFSVLKEVARCQAEEEALIKLLKGRKAQNGKELREHEEEIHKCKQQAWEILKEDRNSFNDNMLLQSVSGGRALHGILLTKQHEDRLAVRECLLEAPKDVLIASESLFDTKIIQFSSECQEKYFKKAVEILGHSAAVSANPVFGASIGANESTKQDEAMHVQREHYSSTVKYSSVEVASFSFTNKDLKLSEDSRGDLHNILEMLKLHGAESGHVMEACQRFFHKYGSHVSRGPLKFGGNFLWSCSSRGFSHSEVKAVEKMQWDAISAAAGNSFAGIGTSTEANIDKIKETHLVKCSDSTRESTHLLVGITGGPQEATDYSSWMSELVANSSTWIITDRGKKFIPVWDIVKKNHKELGEISEVLLTNWEKMSGLKAEQSLLAKLSYDSEAVLEKVNDWNKEKLTCKKIESCLLYLSKVKEDILDKLGNPSIWINEYLSDQIMQKFLKLVANFRFERIKLQMQMLVKLEELKQFDARTFPAIEEVFRSLCDSSQSPTSSSLPKDIPNFQSFDTFLEKTLEKEWVAQLSCKQLFFESLTQSQETIAADVSKAIVLLRSHYQHTYDDVLITILVHPFQSGNCDNVITLSPIALKDLGSMRKLFSEQRKIFNQYVAKKCPLHLQAYLFELAVDHCGEATQCEIQQLFNHIMQMMKALKPSLDKELEECLEYVSSLTTLRENLQHLMTCQPLPPREVCDSHMLKDALKTEVYKCRLQLDDHSSLLKENFTVHSLFMKIGLDNLYPKKLQLKNALCIRQAPLKSSLNGIPPIDPKQLPYLVLHKLMAYDGNCRSDLMPSTSHKNDKDDYDDYDDDEDGGNIFNDEIHPVDILLALILCSDDFLRQDLFSRLAKCQLSVPFILPDPFTKKLTIPLWAMRSIVKEWNCINSSDDLVQHTEPIVNYPMPILSFICFQKKKDGIYKSKSIILNEVISESHSHFFHRDCPGGHYKSLLGEGLVDMSWYLPAGQPDDTFPDAVTFLNLHGDARQHPQQCKFLSEISFTCIVLLTGEVTELDKDTMEVLKMFSLCPGGIVLLDSIGKKPTTVKEEIPDVRIINLTKKNVNEVKLSIQRVIKEKLINGKQSQTIEDVCKSKHGKIHIDEDAFFHHKGLTLANEIISMVTGGRAGSKEKILPLQGKNLWQNWATLDREVYRQVHRGARSVNKYTAHIKKSKLSLRQKQMEHVNHLAPVMNSFIVTLLKLGGPSNQTLRDYFLQCLKLELNNLSRKNISGMQHEYQAIKRELAKLQDKSVSQKAGVEAKIRQYKDRMKVLQDDIINASIGLEHLFREVGQVYEAAVPVPKYGSELSRLPKAVAELLIEGYPLEVMDGDASHVPLKWVTAVFDEAIKMLNDPKVFVLSVLGLQSTGKSTMLNTAFGLQFNVSAGRCTRGAFIQLLSLEDNLRKQTACDYVLVVDTEGLRALELDTLNTQKHDNELGTFVIGLANMTLINILGEVPGDMDDILQTSVHAFLRMTRVKISPSCHFVHQNARSNVKSEVGRAKFTQKLNVFTADAAREEKCEGQYETFNDVIKFDDQEDVHIFPGLWKGDLPMAPVNRGYSISAQTLKLSCIEALDKGVTKGQIPLSSFRQRVGDLWDSLLKENFVFSFKNTLEITAYNSLETEYGKWEWAFHEGMLEWEQKAENEISAAKSEAVPELVKQKCEDLEVHVHEELYSPLKSKMNEFFEGRQAEILVQWKEKFERRLINLSSELQEHADKHCKTLLQSRRVISEIQNKKTEYAKIITKNVQEFILSVKRDQERLNENLTKRKLEPSQLTQILDKELFTPAKLDMYKEKELLTQQQVSGITEVIQRSGGILTETDLSTILVGKILGIDQVKKILKMGQQTEEQLKVMFEFTWIDLVQQLPFVTQENIDLNWEVEVESTLSAFVHSNEGKLIEQLKKQRLTMVASLELVPKRSIHYHIHSGLVASMCTWTRIVRGKTHEEDIEALEITDRIFSTAREYLAKLEKKGTDFNKAFTRELLQIVNQKYIDETDKVKRRLSFTPDYRLDVLSTACGYAIPKFKKMRESFRERHDPRLYLERHVKGPLFTKFKNQYYQAEAEEAIANNICAHLEEPIRTQVRNKLGSKIVGLMKGSDPFFSSKMALKVKILSDIHKEDKFEFYMHYIKDVKGCLEERLKYYTIKFCDEKVSGERTKLQATAKLEVTKLIQFVESKFAWLCTDVRKWVTLFSEDGELKRELGVSLEANDLLAGYESLEQLSLENLKRQFRNGLKDLESRLHSSFENIQCGSEMSQWKDKPHVLLESLIGCTEQCPFCGEQCDLLDPNHVATGRPHSVGVHLSSCLKGYSNDTTKIMMIGFCPSYISGKEEETLFKNAGTNYEWHSFKDYQSIYPNWSIPPDVTSEDSLYWKMFAGKYMKAIAFQYRAKPADVPDEWSKITWDEVRANLKYLYNF